MFNLDTAISTWTHSLKHNRVITNEDVEELESHVRDQVRELISDGATPEEAFRKTMAEMGHPIIAESEYRKVYWGKVRRKQSILSEIRWRAAMLWNYVKTAWRNMMRHKVVAVINLGGLAVALAACLLVGHYITDQLAYDDFHENAERIYRMGRGTTGWPYGQILEAEYPQVDDVLYMRSYPSMSIKKDDAYFFEDMLYAGNEFFRFFDVPLVQGNPETALAEPLTVVLSERLASRLFGNEPAVGQQIIMRDSLNVTVTGVAHVPRRSHIQFDALVSFESLRRILGDGFERRMETGWLDLNVINYVMLSENTPPESLRDVVAGMPREYAGEYLAQFGLTDFEFALEPLPDIYLRSPYGNTLGPSSDISYVWLLAAVGLFLLLIASANFINMATARASERAREVGVRKAVGSSRLALVQQFLGESLLTAITAMLGSVAIAAASLPLFNNLAASSYSLGDLAVPSTVIVLASLVLAVGVAAGLYPAFSVSRFSPVEALRSRFSAHPGGAALRKGLVIFQFSVSGVLIVATLVVLKQLSFMQKRDLGFDENQILVLDARQAPDRMRAIRQDAFKDALLSHPGITAASAAFAVPGLSGWRGQLSFPEGWADDKSIGLEYIAVDHDYVEALGLKVVAGRDFDPSYPSDARTAVMINEAAVEAVGWASPAEAVGNGFASPGSGKPEGVVIGVVEDYHHRSPASPIQPIMYGIRPGNGLYAIRMEAASTQSVIQHIRSTWSEFFGNYPHDITFQDEMFGRQYDQQRRLARIFGSFSILTIVIACLGLFGLATFMVARRTKEIGIRKVLGSSSGDIVRLLSRDFVKLVGIAVILASPIAWYGMRMWLQEFAYRITIGPLVFALTAGLALAVALVTISYQSLRAASSDPVESLRYE